jgi:inner membrane protein
MMIATHTVFSVAITSLVMNTANPILLGLAAIAAQLPDVDTSKSTPGRILLPLSRFLERRFPHRAITHSFLATVVFAVLMIPAVFWGMECWGVLVLGYFCGWFSDVFTKSGVCAFFPSTARLVIPGNPRLRLSTGSRAELFVLGVMVCVAIANINIASNGGVLKAFNQTLGFASGAVEIAAQEQTQYLLVAEISGRNAITQQAVKGEFEVVQPLTQTDLLVKDSQGKLYRAGETQECQILINQVRLQRQGKVSQSVREIQFQEEAIADALSQLPTSDRVYISGLLMLEDAEDLLAPNYPDRFNSIRVQPGSGGVASVHLEAANPAEVVNVLGEYFATGSLLVRFINVQP